MLLAVLLVAITIMMFLVSSSMGLQIGQSTGPTRRAVLGGAGAAFASNFAFPALPAFAADVDTAAIMKAKAGLQAASHAASCYSQPAAHTRRPPHTPFGRRSPRTPTAPPQALIDKGCRKILFFPLYPHYAGATSATANDQFFRALMEQKWQPDSRTVPAYYEHPSYIEALAQSIERSYAQMEQEPDILVCSYHGVPKRYLMEGDPYHCQCQKTTRLLKERLGWTDDKIVTTFQSRFGPEEWLKPYTVEEVARLAESGKKRIAVCAPAFSADCIETLEEINEEIAESFEEAGGESFTYIPCLNDDDAHMSALTEVVEANLKGWLD